MKKCERNKRQGAVLAFVAIGMITMLAMFALVVDAGNLYKERSRLQTAVDAGALAGVSLLPDMVGGSASDRAKDYVQANDSTVARGNITVTFGNTSTVTNGRINVTATKDVDMSFAKFIGFSTVSVSATASAGLQPFGGGAGILPIGVVEPVGGFPVETDVPLKLPVQQQGTLVFGAGDYGFLDVTRNVDVPYKDASTKLIDTANGASALAQNLQTGTVVPLHVGDNVYTEPGNKGSSDIKTEFSALVGQIRLVPIVVESTIKGAVKITGFAAFRITLADVNGKTTLSGQFVPDYVFPGDPGSPSSSTSTVYVAGLVN